MLNMIAKMLFGSRNERILKSLNKVVQKINAMEADLSKLDDAALQAKTKVFQERYQQGESLDKLLPEAFALVREAAKRVLNMRHYDVQLIGGMVLHQGKIAEMRTGEGKTLVATLALYLHALTGKGAHLVTVNDYLAKRDAEQMGQVYAFLGLSTGVIVAGMDPQARKEAYACDITYGTNNEFGFDYLRDNMAFSREEQVQRELNFAVVDEVDSILIDEARTPLIISGAAEDSADMYSKLGAIIPKLTRRQDEDDQGDYYLDEKSKQAFLTDAGHQKVEELLIEMGLIDQEDNLYSAANVSLMHYLGAVLRAHTLFHKDIDYIVKNNEVMIVDEHTGRVMEGRRWSDGLHQAIEAKEGVKVQGENQTLASITYQNYFRLYDTLSGMTGTADTEAFEFHQIYDLEVVVIPTNRPMIRKDRPDAVFLTQDEKFTAIVDAIAQAQKAGQPVLVGTASIETSEYLSQLLKKAKISHNVLNAKQHEREANIIIEAGRPGAVTIATNMAGRGTDIVLGGNWQAEVKALTEPTQKQIDAVKKDWEQRNKTVLEAGGLYIVGSERHESRRIDNQLRGRSGRQGDPGQSRFFLSLEDNLIRIFAPPRLAGFMKRMGMGNGEPLESKMVSKSIANAQKKVESFHFDMRKNLLEYDNVANDQRQVIYTQRQELLEGDQVSDIITNIRQSVIARVVALHMPPGSLEEQWDIEGLTAILKGDFNITLPVQKWLDEDESLDGDAMSHKVVEAIAKAYHDKLQHADSDVLQQYEKMVLLQSLDNHWREHLSAMDHLRNSINLRGYAQKDPKQEYKREAFELFSDMLDRFKYDVISTLSKVEVAQQEDVAAVENQWRHAVTNINMQHAEIHGIGDESADDANAPASAVPQRVEGRKVGRNDPCPCGSGKKYKQCHGKLT
jgi:preprotein translocase subunit SecA